MILISTFSIVVQDNRFVTHILNRKDIVFAGVSFQCLLFLRKDYDTLGDYDGHSSFLFEEYVFVVYM